MEFAEHASVVKFLTHEPAIKVTPFIGAVQKASGSSRPLYAGARANAIAERFVGTIRCECLDRKLILGPRHLKGELAEYVEHYNSHRPHRSLNQRAPSEADMTPAPACETQRVHLRRADVLGGIIHEYRMVA